jgi:transcriptional regulator with XRE-family HTH domain
MTNWIGKARTEQGVSQADLAEFAGITRTQLARLESGQDEPTPAVAAKLRDLLGVKRRGRPPGSAATCAGQGGTPRKASQARLGARRDTHNGGGEPENSP